MKLNQTYEEHTRRFNSVSLRITSGSHLKSYSKSMQSDTAYLNKTTIPLVFRGYSILMQTVRLVSLRKLLK